MSGQEGGNSLRRESAHPDTNLDFPKLGEMQLDRPCGEWFPPVHSPNPSGRAAPLFGLFPRPLSQTCAPLAVGMPMAFQRMNFMPSPEEKSYCLAAAVLSSA
jgi:hypothetical protein